MKKKAGFPQIFLCEIGISYRTTNYFDTYNFQYVVTQNLKLNYCKFMHLHPQSVKMCRLTVIKMEITQVL